MANCTSCGRELPAYRSPRLSTLCIDCQTIENAKEAASPPQRVSAPAASQFDVSLTTVLIGINAAVFVGMVATGVSVMEPTVQDLLKWGANAGPLSLGPQPWRMLTSNYVHIGIIHIALNMWCLWNLGQLAQRIFDRWTYIFIYTATGLAGSLASLWWHPQGVGAGASGAIFGLAGALIAALYLGKLPVSKQAISSTLRSLLVFAGYNLFFGLVPGIDNSAHLGGLVSGLALGAILAKHLTASRETRSAWRNYTVVATVVVLVLANGLVRREARAAGTVGYAAPDPSLQSAAKAFREGHYEEALPPLRDFVQRNPDSPQGHYLLGLAYASLQHPDEAIASFQKALTLQPGYADAEAGLAAAYQAKGMQKEADEASAKATEFRRAQNGR